jgi:hypothetical protein
VAIGSWSQACEKELLRIHRLLLPLSLVILGGTVALEYIQYAENYGVIR